MRVSALRHLAILLFVFLFFLFSNIDTIKIGKPSLDMPLGDDVCDRLVFFPRRSQFPVQDISCFNHGARWVSNAAQKTSARQNAERFAGCRPIGSIQKEDGRLGQPPDASDGINCSYAGKTNQFVADYSGTVSADYGMPFGNGNYFNAVLDVIFTDSYMLTSTLDPRAVQDSYTKLNGRVAVSFADNQWELAWIVRNMTDEAVLSYASDVPLAGSSFGAPGFYALVEQPRSYALQVSYRFK